MSSRTRDQQNEHIRQRVGIRRRVPGRPDEPRRTRKIRGDGFGQKRKGQANDLQKTREMRSALARWQGVDAGEAGEGGEGGFKGTMDKERCHRGTECASACSSEYSMAATAAWSV
jgi:hypothetical protein